MPEISVITPAFRPSSFGALKASIAANRGADAEWIVVDDGSGPNYEATFAELQDTPARVIRRAQNRRQGAARNAGLAQAAGSWVKFLDADDRLDHGHLTALLAAAKAAPQKTIAFAPTRHIFPGGRISVNDSWRDLPSDPDTQLARLLHAPFLSHCGALFPRALIADLGGYDENLVTDEDGDLLIRALMGGHSFAAVPEVQYYYIHHGNGDRVSLDAGGAKLAARLRVCDKVEAAFTERGAAMPDAVRYGLALRLDKIAVAYWNENRQAARAALDRARHIYPYYQPPGSWPVRILRALGGPSAIVTSSRLYRRARGRPGGGAQG